MGVDELLLVGEIVHVTKPPFVKPGDMLPEHDMEQNSKMFLMGVKKTMSATITYDFKPVGSWSYDWVGKNSKERQMHCFRIYAFTRISTTYTCVATTDSSPFTVESSKKTQRQRQGTKAAQGPRKRQRMAPPLGPGAGLVEFVPEPTINSYLQGGMGGMHQPEMDLNGLHGMNNLVGPVSLNHAQTQLPVDSSGSIVMWRVRSNKDALGEPEWRTAKPNPKRMHSQFLRVGKILNQLLSGVKKAEGAPIEQLEDDFQAIFGNNCSDADNHQDIGLGDYAGNVANPAAGHAVQQQIEGFVDKHYNKLVELVTELGEISAAHVTDLENAAADFRAVSSILDLQYGVQPHNSDGSLASIYGTVGVPQQNAEAGSVAPSAFAGESRLQCSS
jgi:hypothetical protein